MAITGGILVSVPDTFIAKKTTDRKPKPTERKPAATVTVFAEPEPTEPEIFGLTTIWKPPCNSIFHWADVQTKPCLPPDASPEWIKDGGYYSPGICFGGYTSGCEVQPSGIKRGQTAALCVPSGWKCGDNKRFATNPEDLSQTDVLAFQIRWEEDDLSILETHPQTPEAITTGETTGDEATDSSLGPAETSGAIIEEGEQDDNAVVGGISRCTVVGIAVGVALSVILLCAAAFYWYRRRYLKPPLPPPKYGFDNEKTEDDTSHTVVSRKMGAPGTYAWNRPVPRTPMAELCAETTLVQQGYAQGDEEVLSPRKLDYGICRQPPLVVPNRRSAPRDVVVYGAHYSAGARSQEAVDYTAARRNESVFQIKRKSLARSRVPS